MNKICITYDLWMDLKKQYSARYRLGSFSHDCFSTDPTNDKYWTEPERLDAYLRTVVVNHNQGDLLDILNDNGVNYDIIFAITGHKKTFGGIEMIDVVVTLVTNDIGEMLIKMAIPDSHGDW
jgi:hypothetical protein